jgi:hypothetical protein
MVYFLNRIKPPQNQIYLMVKGETLNMDISGVSSFSNGLAGQATGMKANQVQQAIQVSVLKQTMDQQKAAADAVVRMLQDSPTPRAAGGRVDISI